MKLLLNQFHAGFFREEIGSLPSLGGKALKVKHRIQFQNKKTVAFMLLNL